MKKPVIIAIVIAIVLIIIVGAVIAINVIKGNSNETNIKVTDADTFRDFMQQRGYLVLDSTNQVEAYENMVKLYVAISQDYDYTIEFYELTDDDYATKFYNTNRYNFQSAKTDSDRELVISLENGLRYTLSSESQYRLVSRNNNTMIYINTEATDFKEEIENVLTEMGY